MKTTITRFGVLILMLSFVSIRGAFGQITVFSDNFESGKANAAWAPFYKGEDSAKAKPASAAPKALTGSGSYVGWLQDVDLSYTGSAVAVAGPTSLRDYSIEADVYCYVNPSPSGYSGLVVYADTSSSKREFYKLRVDFDASDRINLSGLKTDPNTFLPVFSKDFKGVDNPGLFPTTDSWHKMKIEIRNTSAKQTSIWCYFDGTLLKGCPIIDTLSWRPLSGQFGLYSFQQGTVTGLASYFDNIVVKTLPTPVDFTENFESGKANTAWGVFYKGEDSVKAKPASAAPKALTGSGSYVGWLQDVDLSYTGSAVAVAGSASLRDYSIEADVYCYVNPSPSGYSGLVVYADTSTSSREFYKLRVDFDASDRINLSGLKTDPNTFLPVFSKDFKGVDNPGLFPTTDSWHKMKIEIRSTSATQTSIWCYFDGTLLKGCPIIDTLSWRPTSGQFGLYSFQQGTVTGLASYFDNIVVKSLSAATAVEDLHVFSPSVPTEFTLQQNYPNPFNPATKITFALPKTGSIDLRVYDMLGREVAVLATGTRMAGAYTVTFDGAGLSSGLYLYRLTAGNFSETKKMMLVK